MDMASLTVVSYFTWVVNRDGFTRVLNGLCPRGRYPVAVTVFHIFRSPPLSASRTPPSTVNPIEVEGDRILQVGGRTKGDFAVHFGESQVNFSQFGDVVGEVERRGHLRSRPQIRLIAVLLPAMPKPKLSTPRFVSFSLFPLSSVKEEALPFLASK